LEPLGHGAIRFRHLVNLREHVALARFRLQLLGALLIAARYSFVNPLDFLPLAVVLLADFCVAFLALIVSSYEGSPMS